MCLCYSGHPKLCSSALPSLCKRCQPSPPVDPTKVIYGCWISKVRCRKTIRSLPGLHQRKALYSAQRRWRLWTRKVKRRNHRRFRRPLFDTAKLDITGTMYEYCEELRSYGATFYREWTVRRQQTMRQWTMALSTKQLLNAP
jgi:hypothetical protein